MNVDFTSPCRLSVIFPPIIVPSQYLVKTDVFECKSSSKYSEGKFVGYDSLYYHLVLLSLSQRVNYGQHSLIRIINV